MSETAWLPTEVADLPQWRAAAAEHMLAVRRAAGEVGYQPMVEQALDRAITEHGELAPDHFVWRRDASGETGWLWLIRRPDVAVIADAVIPDAWLPTAFDELPELVRGLDRTALTFSAFRDDPVGAALRTPDAKLIATHMQIEVADVPVPDGLTLRPMTPGQYAEFERYSVDNYAQETLAAGAFPNLASAERNARDSFSRLLPNGPDSKGHWLWTAYAGDTEVGMLWVETQAERAFIYNIEVAPAQRRKGYATQILRAGAEQTRIAGRNVLALNVWGNNTGAKQLYDVAGYYPTEQNFRREFPKARRGK